MRYLHTFAFNVSWEPFSWGKDTTRENPERKLQLLVMLLLGKYFLEAQNEQVHREAR